MRADVPRNDSRVRRKSFKLGAAVEQAVLMEAGTRGLRSRDVRIATLRPVATPRQDVEVMAMSKSRGRSDVNWRLRSLRLCAWYRRYHDDASFGHSV